MELRWSPTSITSRITLSAIKIVGIRFFTISVTSEVVVNITPFTIVKPFMPFICFPLSFMKFITTRISLIHEFSTYLNLWPVINFELSNPSIKSSSNNQIGIVMLIVVYCIDHVASERRVIDLNTDFALFNTSCCWSSFGYNKLGDIPLVVICSRSSKVCPRSENLKSV